MITLCDKGKHKKVYIHRLVAEYFIDNPYGYEEVNHINYVKTDNRSCNLEWCTRQQNNLHAFEKHSPIRNFKECKLMKAGQIIGKYRSIEAASRAAHEMFGVSRSSINKNRKIKDIEIVA